MRCRDEASCMMPHRSVQVDAVPCLGLVAFSGLVTAPKSLRDFGGIDLSMGRFFEPGGRSDRLIGPEGQLGLLDRMGQPKADWCIHICIH